MALSLHRLVVVGLGGRGQQINTGWQTDIVAHVYVVGSSPALSFLLLVFGHSVCLYLQTTNDLPLSILTQLFNVIGDRLSNENKEN